MRSAVRACLTYYGKPVYIMRDDRFEWDDRKAASNLRKHGVAFDHARLVFDDPAAIEDLDDDQDEERYWRLGVADARVLYVIYTVRGERIRIISARKAKRHEQDGYDANR